MNKIYEKLAALKQRCNMELKRYTCKMWKTYTIESRRIESKNPRNTTLIGIPLIFMENSKLITNLRHKTGQLRRIRFSDIKWE